MVEVKYSDQYWKDIDTIVKKNPIIKQIKNKKILITGATGMVCSSVVDVLLYLNKYKGYNVRLTLAGRNAARVKARFKKFDVDVDYYFIQFDATKDIKLNLEVDYIIHGASNANPVAYSKEPVETALGNIIGTNALLRFSAQNKVKNFLFLSSSEVYGKKKENQPYRECDYGFIDILNYRSAYPNAKRLAETLCIAYQKEFEVKTSIVRLGHIYGPTISATDSRASAIFTREAVAGNDIVMKSSGNQLRSYCYTLDCASAMLTVLIIGKAGEAYNVSNSSSVVTIREMAEELAKVGGVNIIYQNASEQEKKSYNLMLNSALDSTKLENLGWNACFNLHDGVKATVNLLSGH